MPASVEAAVLATDEKAFAGYPAPFVFDKPKGTKKLTQLLWGDFVGLKGEEDGDWIRVRARGVDGWMKKSECQTERLLELNFVDVGQGDGCFVVTPDDESIVIDAGEGDNMFRYLSWRYNLRSAPTRVITCTAGVITHPDMDHYKGFGFLFDSNQIRFKNLFHNGIVERAGDNRLGPEDEIEGVKYLLDVVADQDALTDLVNDPQRAGRLLYPNLMKKAVSAAADEVTMLSSETGLLPGLKEGSGLKFEVLGPVPEHPDGKTCLRVLGKEGVTKNGHSVCLRLVYHRVRILLTGDLNVPAETYLLGHYTGKNIDELQGDERAAALTQARRHFEADVAKACHHGSADFTTTFLRSINAIATVVSSGDDEPFAHPRPDTLGSLGKYARGDRPLILSTELARSARENIKKPNELRARIDALFSEREGTTGAEREAIQRKIDELLETLERSIAVYGLINLRTDGHKVVLAQKLEAPAPSGAKWDVHLLEPDDDGDLHYVSKH